ncbi:MAG: SLC13 family permease [Longimonas sp.]|uniref:SLC13 family permease n=1 Tax=Longimonas sp. TaxID=2039626 RepID=UPI00397513EF
MVALFEMSGLLLQAPAAELALNMDMLVVFGIIAVALVLFVTEALPLDITATGVLVALIVLEPWTQIGPQEGLMGFANPATITVLAMFILSEGVRRTGFIQWLGDKFVEWGGDSSPKQFAMLTGLSGSAAGMINNTPVVAMMIPMANDIAKKTKTSPSKYLMPISFISMIGGMLTVIGTSTNLLASDISGRLIDRSFTMFEFTHLGAILLVIGFLYLFFVARHLIPERIKPEEDLAKGFEMDQYLTEVSVREGSDLEGKTVREVVRALSLDADIIHLVREGEKFAQPLARKEVRANDRLMIRTDRNTLLELLDQESLHIAPTTAGLTDSREVDPQAPRRLVEVVMLPDTDLMGETIGSLRFEERYEANVLAIRRGREVVHDHLPQFKLRGGDSLLVFASDQAFKQLSQDRRFIVTREEEPPKFRAAKMPIALGIVLAVVGLAGAGVLSILVTSLMGMLAMVATGCLRPNEVYDAVDWPVIFLLAGMIPLGTAMEETGGAQYLAGYVVQMADVLPGLALLFVFYVFTALITQVVSNNASVVLMLPVAVDTALLIDADPFSFVLAVTFAASTAMLTPIGYQTNLMVYGPGGYTFGDFFRIGAPLQLILAVATALGIYVFWGV